MSYGITPGGNQICWTRKTLLDKLQTLGMLHGKHAAWIRADLSLSPSNWLTRLVWKIAARHFSWMRRYLYGVDLKKSRTLLQDLHDQVKGDPILEKAYQQALSVFNTVAPRHYCHPPAKELVSQLFEAQCYDEGNAIKKLQGRFKLSHAQARKAWRLIARDCVHSINRSRASLTKVHIPLLQAEGRELKFFKVGLERDVPHPIPPGTCHRLLEFCPNVQGISIRVSYYTEKLIDKISQCRNTRLLKLECNYANGMKDRDLSKVVAKMSSLHTLKISYISIDPFPLSILKISSLRSLTLKRNGITGMDPFELSGALTKLTHLRFLKIAYNSLKTLPEEIGSLGNLRELQLQGNDLKKLPKGLGKLTKLRVLYLDDNELGKEDPERLDNVLGKLNGLKEFSAANNGFSLFPQSIGKLRELRKLNISGNPLNMLPGAPFVPLRRLECLNLKDCGLLRLPEELKSLKQLAVIDISGNDLLMDPIFNELMGF